MLSGKDYLRVFSGATEEFIEQFVNFLIYNFSRKSKVVIQRLLTAAACKVYFVFESHGCS